MQDSVELYQEEFENYPQLAQAAEEMAENTIQAYISHDKGDLEKSSKYFSKVFEKLFPAYNPQQIKLAADSYVKSLSAQDVIENDPSLSLKEKLKHPDWERTVQRPLLELCECLDLPKDWAYHTKEFFRLHGPPRIHKRMYSLRHVKHVLIADRILVNRVTGSDYMSNITGPIYLALVDCHDKHDLNGLVLGKELSKKYFYLLLFVREGYHTKGSDRIW